MSKLFRTALIFCVLITVALTLASQSAYAAPKKAVVKKAVPVKKAVEQIPETCASYLVAEAKSGEIIDSSASDIARPPASMTKLMTAYVIFKKIKEGTLSLDEQVTINAEASKIGGSQVYLKEGEVFTIKELLNALLIQSANDAALALAQHISGSREGFVEEMNQAATEIGMTHALFQSPHGLPPSQDQVADLVSAEDFLALARALIQNYPEVLEITKKEVEPFRNGTFEMRNHNGLLRTFDGTDGLKTGFYNEAGFCVTTTAERKGIRLIAVMMGCTSRKIRDQQAAALLSKAFAQFKTAIVVKAGEAAGTVNVTNGLAPQVSLTVKEQISATGRIGKDQSIERRIKPCTLTAPVTKGKECGEIELLRGTEVLGSSPLLVAEDVAEAGMVKKVLGKFGW